MDFPGPCVQTSQSKSSNPQPRAEGHGERLLESGQAHIWPQIDLAGYLLQIAAGAVPDLSVWVALELVLEPPLFLSNVRREGGKAGAAGLNDIHKPFHFSFQYGKFLKHIPMRAVFRRKDEFIDICY